MDSTPVSVCHNPYICTHRVTKGYASRGKTSKEWFYGFKLHGVCDGTWNVVSLRFTTGGTHDSREAESITEGLSGLFVGDAGYILKQEVFERLMERHRRILAAGRKNMKRVMTGE